MSFNDIFNFINDWIGIILFVVGVIFYVFFNWKDAKEFAKAWIFEAERQARDNWLRHDGENKKAWVIGMYPALPARIKYILTILAPIFRFKHGEDVWAWLVQRVFDWLRQRVKQA